ncbi:MAG: ribosomal protein S18 acetylase RimI-like enzyme [Hyphomicrobiaceae bacterium]|jgi:ribosomal protein S18 acetylase RimI-like enzyme
MTESELLELADLNYLESNRGHVRWGGGEIAEWTGRAVYMTSANEFAAGPYNSAMAVGVTPVADAHAWIEAARAWFAARDRDFTVCTRSHLDAAVSNICMAAAWYQFGDAPGMAIAAPVNPRTLPEAVRIVAVGSAQAARDFIEVAAASFESIGLPPSVARAGFGAPEDFQSPYWFPHVLYDREQPVACAGFLLSHGIAGVYWVGSIPEARGRGFADAVTRSVTNAAFALGARVVILQASEGGEPVYQRMGYREFTRYRSFLVPRAE